MHCFKNKLFVRIFIYCLGRLHRSDQNSLCYFLVLLYVYATYFFCSEELYKKLLRNLSSWCDPYQQNFVFDKKNIQKSVVSF